MGARHKRDGDPDSPDNIGKTRRYLEDFSAALEKARNHTDLYEAMLALYPGRVNRAVIWHFAKAFLGRRLPVRSARVMRPMPGMK